MTNNGKELKFKDIVIFYNQVFDLGTPLDPNDAARKLLKTDYSLSSTNYYKNEIEIADRFKKLLNLRHIHKQLLEAITKLEKDGLKKFTFWAIVHPKIVYLLLNSYFHDNQYKNKEVDRKTEDILKESLKYIDTQMASIQSLESLQMYSDKLLLSPLYLDDTPFTRIGLQPYYAEIDGEWIPIDVEFLIHRTGIGILSFYISYNKEKTLKNLIDISSSQNVLIIKSRVVKELVDIQSYASGLTKTDLEKASFKKEFSSGVNWYIHEHKETISLDNVFNLYKLAIISTLYNKLPKNMSNPYPWIRTDRWHAYPIIFLKQLPNECPTLEKMKTEYKGALAGLIAGFNKWEIFTDNTINNYIKNDLSDTSDKCIYIEENQALILYNESYLKNLKTNFGNNIPGQEWLFEFFQISSIIELLLVQKWIFYVLGIDIRNLKHDADKLNSIKNSLLLALEDYFNHITSYGTTEDMINKLKEKMRINDLYQEILEKLNITEKFIEVEKNDTQNKQNLLMQIIILIASIVIGVASANSFADVINSTGILPLNRIVIMDIYLIFLIILIYVYIEYLLYTTFVKSKIGNVIISYNQIKSIKKKSLTWPIKFRVIHRK
jgi:hypothetical protein